MMKPKQEKEKPSAGDELGLRENPSHTSDWAFRPEAVVWVHGEPVRANLHPVASQLYSWLRRKGDVTYFTEKMKSDPGMYTNPYAFDASTLARVFLDVVNETHAAGESHEDIEPHDMEVVRIRLTGELTLLSARLLEAVLRQMLFCTAFPKKSYENASLGQLMSTECRACKGGDGPAHHISLVASLGCRYGMCRQIDACVVSFLKLLNKQRAQAGAHASTPSIVDRPVAESRKMLAEDCFSLGEGLCHALQHVSEVEEAMILEIERHAADSQRRSLVILPSKSSPASTEMPDPPATS